MKERTFTALQPDQLDSHTLINKEDRSQKKQNTEACLLGSMLPQLQPQPKISNQLRERAGAGDKVS